MSLIGEQVLLRIYLESGDRAPFLPTYEKIIEAARKQKMAGATVLRGILGAGYHRLLHESSWSLIEHVPIIDEIVDRPEKIATFVRDTLDGLMTGGMLTLERAAVMMYRQGDRAEGVAAVPNPSDPLCLANALKPLSTLPHIEPGTPMKVQENAVLLRVFIGESDKFEHQPLHEAIVQKVRELGLAGATVLRGTEGFGARSVVHKSALLAMSSDLPIVIEIVDSQEKVNLLLPHLDAMVKEGMITMEHVLIVMYRHQ